MRWEEGAPDDRLFSENNILDEQWCNRLPSFISKPISFDLAITYVMLRALDI